VEPEQTNMIRDSEDDCGHGYGNMWYLH